MVTHLKAIALLVAILVFITACVVKPAVLLWFAASFVAFTLYAAAYMLVS